MRYVKKCKKKPLVHQSMARTKNQKFKKYMYWLNKEIFSRFSLRRVNKFYLGIEQQIFFPEPFDIIVRNSKPNFLIVILSFKYSVEDVSIYMSTAQMQGSQKQT